MVSAAQVKELRERTGAGMMDCRKALEATGGDVEAAIEKMRMEGQAKADKKASRVAADGAIAVAVGADAIALLEVNSETDFVAKGDEFQALAAAAAKTVLEKRPATVEQLGTLKIGAQTLDEMRRALVTKIGENITFRRFEVVKKSGGAIAHYLHGTRIGVVVTLEKGDAELAKDLAMHVTASRPLFLSADRVPADVVQAERKIIEAQTAEQAQGKPAEIVAKMVDGKLRKFLSEITLLGQPFVKDPDQTVEKLLKAKGAAVANFVRFEVGEGIEKKEADFAAEVMATAQAAVR